MKFRVVYSMTVRSAISAHIDYLKSQGASQDRIERWFERLFDLLESLAEHPLRYPAEVNPTGSENTRTRRLAYMDFVVTYRVDDAEGVVELLTFRHAAMQPPDANAN